MIKSSLPLITHCYYGSVTPFLSDPMDCSMPPLSSTILWSLLKFISIESVMISNHLILCHPLLLQPSIFPTTGVCYSESPPRIRWPKCWSFTFSISPSNEYSGLISFRRSLEWSQHYQMANIEIRLIIFIAAKDGKALYSQQKQDRELTVAQIMNSFCQIQT